MIRVKIRIRGRLRVRVRVIKLAVVSLRHGPNIPSSLLFVRCFPSISLFLLLYGQNSFPIIKMTSLDLMRGDVDSIRQLQLHCSTSGLSMQWRVLGKSVGLWYRDVQSLAVVCRVTQPSLPWSSSWTDASDMTMEQRVCRVWISAEFMRAM